MRRWFGTLVLVLMALLGGPARAHAEAEATHPHVCTAAATPSTTDIDCLDWNAAHVWGGPGAADGRFPYYLGSAVTNLAWSDFWWYDAVEGAFRFSVAGTGPTVHSNTVTLGAMDNNGAGTGSLRIVTELGGHVDLAEDGFAAKVTVVSAAATSLEFGTFLSQNTYLSTNAPYFGFGVGGADRVVIDSAGNVGIGPSPFTFGASAAGVLALAVGTCETTSPADHAALCVRDRNGAATAELARRNEEGHLESFGTFVHARVSTEATNTGGAADMVTLNTNVNVPVTDGAVVRFSWRKSAGAAASVSIGLKVNTTQIISNLAVASATNQAENGYCEITIWNRATNYLRSLKATCWNNVDTTLTKNLFAGADMANAAITDIRITGLSASGSVTLGVRDVVVQRIAGF